MAKKKKETIVEENIPQPEDVLIKEPVVKKEEPVVKKEEPQEPKWKIKDRTYYLKGNRQPLSFHLKSSGIYWFDEKAGYERELKNTVNQRTPFVDEMKGDQLLEHIVFRNGVLTVPRNKTVLQKLLSLYHPHRDILYEEFVPAKRAADQLDYLELEIEALKTASEVDIDMAEAVMRAEIGSKVSKMSSKELKRDLLLFAKKNPKLFLDLVGDENVMLRNFGIRATEMGVIKLSHMGINW